MIGAHNQDFRTIPDLWPESQGLPALDLGCGGGLYTRELARRGLRAVGLELDLANLREARRQAGEPGLAWVQADATRLPFREGTFGLVVCVEVLTHLPPASRRDVLTEVRRVAAPRASIFLTLHNRARLTLSRWLRLRPRQAAYDTSNLTVWPTCPQEAARMAMECGLQRCGPPIYLNYHPRFTRRFRHRHPHLSGLVIIAEELLRRLPLLRRLGITFLLRLVNRPDQALGSR